MSSVTKRYENRQPGYSHRFLIEYRWDSRGYYTLWAKEYRFSTIVAERTGQPSRRPLGFTAANAHSTPVLLQEWWRTGFSR